MLRPDPALLPDLAALLAPTPLLALTAAPGSAPRVTDDPSPRPPFGSAARYRWLRSLTES